MITAEKIEALNIRTSNLEVNDGAKIGNYIIDSGGLRSGYTQIYPVGGIPDMMKEGRVKLDLSKIEIEDSYGGSLSYPQKHTQLISIESDNLTLTRTITGGHIGTNGTTSLTIKADGIYKNGVKVL